MDGIPTDEQLKVAANQLLWEQLPPTATIKEAESLALEIFAMLRQAWNRHEEATREGGAA